MAHNQDAGDDAQPDSGGTVTVVKPKAARPRPRRLPPWNVLLHNDDVNDMVYVKNIGAYSCASAVPNFNGFPPAKIVMV